MLKFIEIVLKYENDFDIPEFYRIQTFSRSWQIVIFFEFLIFWEIKEGGAPPFKFPKR